MKTSTLRRTSAVAALAAALTLGLGACTSSTPPKAGNPVTNVTPTASASPSASTTGIPASVPEVTLGADGKFNYCANQAPFTGEAADAFGADNVAAAYCEMVTFTLDAASFDEALMRPAENRRAVEFSGFNDYMTPTMQDAWAATVDKALAGDDQAEVTVNSMAFYDMEGDGLTLVKDSPLVVGKAFGPAATAVDDSVEGTERLAMTFDVSAFLVMQRDGKPAFVPVKKTMTYWLVPNGTPERPWLIDTFEGSYTFDKALDTLPAPAE